MKQLTMAALAFVALAAPAHAQGDPAEGENVFRRCQACHAVGEGAAHKVGPHLNNLIGRTAGSLEDYNYSAAMVEAGEGGLVWNDETLSEYLQDPRGYIPGNKMAFAGLRDEEDLANVIAYLHQFDEGDDAQQ